ncbi:hypothetical protein KIN20_028692 [Parelaphostrongylus tenuis]|uniref:Uncharacterized protein n=1 Tax=Parelaphostrongylus tenuis TaxID=148309 RepID=A0AAD5R1G5_PARTN|nr:hypothetical protein KIN20_028692 [Parelaphostrongylus tenuis]
MKELRTVDPDQSGFEEDKAVLENLSIFRQQQQKMCGNNEMKRKKGALRSILQNFPVEGFQ